jgi:hypothetical protein
MWFRSAAVIEWHSCSSLRCFAMVLSFKKQQRRAHLAKRVAVFWYRVTGQHALPWTDMTVQGLHVWLCCVAWDQLRHASWQRPYDCGRFIWLRPFCMCLFGSTDSWSPYVLWSVFTTRAAAQITVGCLGGRLVVCRWCVSRHTPFHPAVMDVVSAPPSLARCDCSHVQLQDAGKPCPLCVFLRA